MSNKCPQYSNLIGCRCLPQMRTHGGKPLKTLAQLMTKLTRRCNTKPALFAVAPRWANGTDGSIYESLWPFDPVTGAKKVLVVYLVTLLQLLFLQQSVCGWCSRAAMLPWWLWNRRACLFCFSWLEVETWNCWRPSCLHLICLFTRGRLFYLSRLLWRLCFVTL